MRARAAPSFSWARRASSTRRSPSYSARVRSAPSWGPPPPETYIAPVRRTETRTRSAGSFHTLLERRAVACTACARPQPSSLTAGADGGLGGALIGLTGLSPLVEACSDVCVGKETSASGATRITYAIAAPGLQAMLQLLYLTAFPSVHDAWTVAPLVVVSAVVSSLSLSLQFATYPATPSGRGRLGGGLTTAHDALSAQLAAQRANVDSAAGGCAWWPPAAHTQCTHSH
jgi:hypothetical protein